MSEPVQAPAGIVPLRTVADGRADPAVGARAEPARLRTLGCGQVTPSHYGTRQSFAGWIHTVRAKGTMAFLVLRDRTGTVQFVLKREEMEKAGMGALFNDLVGLTPESVVSLTGDVRATEKAR